MQIRLIFFVPDSQLIVPLCNMWKISFDSRRVLHHSLFWAIIFFGLLAIEVTMNRLPWGYALLSEGTRLVTYLILIYFNLYILIPRLLNEKKVLLYGISILSTVLILTPLLIRALYWIYAPFPELREQLVRHQTGYYILNFLLTALFAVFKIGSDWIRNERENRRIKTENMQTELRFLKSQINPHFLFNTLNSLYALTIRKSDQAPEIVLKLADMMRYMLYECNEKWVTLQREIQYIQNYLELEKLRHGAKSTVTFEVIGNPADIRIAPLLFIPFLENSFKHGLSKSFEDAWIEAKMTIDKEKIIFVIRNKKASRLVLPDEKKFGGIGLTNVKKRLALLYPDHHTLVIRDMPGVYEVELHLDHTFNSIN